jgi:hypothetical protein
VVHCTSDEEIYRPGDTGRSPNLQLNISEAKNPLPTTNVDIVPAEPNPNDGSRATKVSPWLKING